MGRTPRKSLEGKPTKQSIYFAGKHIKLAAIARNEGIDQSYLSRVFSGQRQPRIAHARKIARGLGMSTDAFLDAIAARRQSLALAKQRQILASALPAATPNI